MSDEQLQVVQKETDQPFYPVLNNNNNSNNNNNDAMQIDDKNETDTDQNNSNKSQPESKNLPNNNNNESSSDDTNSNDNNSPVWSCKTCTYANTHDDNLCAMCYDLRYGYDMIHENVWNTLLSFNHNKLTQIPQWIKCNTCNIWRTINISISDIKTWQPPLNYSCPPHICKKEQSIPTQDTHTTLQLFALCMQRTLAVMKQDGPNTESVRKLDTAIKSYTMKIEKQQKLTMNTVPKSDTIIIEPESENEPENKEKSSNSWECVTCTFVNTHLGNLCAMCETAKPGSTITKMSDEMYAQYLHKSFEAGREISTTPDLAEPLPDLIESSPDIQNNNNNNNKLAMNINLPINAEVGPFGAITCVSNGHRQYLLLDPTTTTLKWEKSPPTQPQTWVEQHFGTVINTLPKMNKTQRQQIEQLNGQSHYFDQPTDLINKIDLTTDNHNNHSNDDIEILDLTKKDHEYAKKLQTLFNDESIPQHTTIPKHNGYHDFENRHKPKNKNNTFNLGDEDIIPFDFSYPGMHASDNLPLLLPGGNGVAPSDTTVQVVDNSKQSVGEMLNMGLRQENIAPIEDVKGLSITLFEHQKKGVAWMLQMEQDRNCKGGFLCDQMGVGKTIQIIALMKKSRDMLIVEQKRKYKEDGYLSESEYEESVDSQDETCGGFVVDDDRIDFESDVDGGGDGDSDDDDWFPGMDYGNNNTDNRKKEESEEAISASRPLRRRKRRKRGKKRKFSEVDDDDSERTLDEEEDGISCLNDLNRENKENRNNSNNSNSNSNSKREKSDSPFILHDIDDEETQDEDDEVSPNLVGGILDKMRNKNKKKKKKKKKRLDDYFSNQPVKKRRKLNNGHAKKKKKKKKAGGNDIYKAWLAEKQGKSAKKPWINTKQRTLIVGPLAIIDQWAEEIANRAPNQFKVCVYHGGNRKKKFNKYKLRKYDVIITTFGHITSEYAKGNEEKQDGLFKLPTGFFHRVVLDEAHTIKNPSSQQSKACAYIGNHGVKVRWCLTGTPIQNKLLDLFPLCRFLQIKQCGTAKDFKSFLRLNSKGTVSGRSKQLVTSFLAAHMLRRLKSEVVDDLVSKTEEVIELEFDDAEDLVYKAFQNHARSRFNKFVQAGTAKKNYAHILVLLLRLRQICDHPYLAMKPQDGQSEAVGGDSDSDGDGDSMNVDDGGGGDPLSRIDANIIKRLNDRESILDSECPICLDIFNDGIMFPRCGHLVCKEHLYDLDEKCPECRGIFKIASVISFSTIVKSGLIDEKHKKSLLANDGKDGLIMDGNIVAEKMGNVHVSPEKQKTKRRIVWRKICAAKGKFRSAEQINRQLFEEKEQKEQKNEESETDMKNKLKKMQEKFEWSTYTCDEKFDAEFEDDDEEGYNSDDKYPNPESGWKFIPSSKTKMMMQKIRAIRSGTPDDKIIIFSQFTTMLSILERVLRKYNINYLMYDGSKTRQERKNIIHDFKNDSFNDIPVMLMSLKCAALGLNLTVANHVMFCDLWWNPAIESQAIDRVHRIGQEKHVFITRMIIKTSVEERILSLQREKQKIADSALDGANFAKKHGLSVQDLAMLFGSDESIMAMAARQSGNGSSGFDRNSLMRVRRRPSLPPHGQNGYQNYHNHNHHNHNHHEAVQVQQQYVNNGYLNSLDAATQALIARLQSEQ